MLSLDTLVNVIMQICTSTDRLKKNFILKLQVRMNENKRKMYIHVQCLTCLIKIAVILQ